MRNVFFYLFILFLILFLAEAQAQIPRLINYQGMLLDSDEQPVAERDYKITFNLYDESDNLLWSEVHNKVFIDGGMFHVLLGTVNPLNIPFDKPYFLGIQVENDPELQPRMMITSAAYSFRAEDADKVAGIRVSTTAQPNTLLPLDGSGKFPSSVLSGGAASGDFLRKNAPDTSRGTSAAPMLLLSNLGDGDGINGRNIGGNGRGVVGRSDNSDGVAGWSGASDKSGVFGHGVDGYGVTGRSDNNYGVQGLSTKNDGVYGESYTNNKSGVYGHSQSGIGVTGRSGGNDGLLGVTTSSNANHAAIRARNEGAGLAIASEGNVLVSGRTTTKVLEITGGADLSEQFDVVTNNLDGTESSEKQIQPGMVVSIDLKNTGRLVVSNKAYDQAVAGIISGAGGVKPGMLMGQSGTLADGTYPVALTGRVYCLVDASNKAIEAGDLLTTSKTPGHAMKVTDHTRANGSIIGKAMTPLAHGKGLVLVLVTLQ